MTKREALNGKPYAGNPHVRFDEGEAASTATSRRGSLLYKTFFLMLMPVVCCAHNTCSKEDILTLIKKTEDPDERERNISNAFPDVYHKLKMEYYPKLRTVDFVFHLSRRGMVEDVMYTDVIDTEYAEAIRLMDERKYKEAMPKLLEYRDMNTAICYMSLGYNGTAVNILLEQPETADREYLLAVLYARLNMDELAVQLFLKSCKMDESKIERGELDPEIAELIKENNLYNQLYN